jgi:hypothetical protein
MDASYSVGNIESRKAKQKLRAINFYISQEAIQGWMTEEKSGKRGASNKYSNIAIETSLTDFAP